MVYFFKKSDLDFSFGGQLLQEELATVWTDLGGALHWALIILIVLTLGLLHFFTSTSPLFELILLESLLHKRNGLILGC